jgi:hypothetical protein
VRKGIDGGVVMSIFIVFSPFSFFLFLSSHSLTELETRADGGFVSEKKGAKSPSSKNEGKITIGLHSRCKITNLPSLYVDFLPNMFY